MATALLCFLSLVLGLTSAVQVTISSGVIEGYSQGKLSHFLGVPYAAAPTGNLRWMPPTSPQPWSGVFNATDKGVACWSFSDQPQAHSEDCLHLNVITRTADIGSTDLHPVIVFLHGGSNIDGSKDSYPHLEGFATLKDFVVVSVNFRLGALGFLALEELAQQDPRGVSGNYAILDIQFALKWIQTNIAKFGGNPQKVTLLGQSSGGTNIHALLASPGSKGLFHAAITLSGSPNITMGLPQAYNESKQIVKAFGCEGAPDVVACLRALDASFIAKNLPLCYTSLNFGNYPETKKGPAYCGLTIADGVTVLNVENAYANGIMDVPVIFQSLQAEADAFATYANDMTPDQLVADVNNWFVTTGWPQSAIDAWEQLYHDELQVSSELTYTTFISDLAFICGLQTLAIQAGKGFSSNVYVGWISYPPSGPFPSAFVPGVFSHYAFHMWDYFGAVQYWPAPYVPSAKDIEFGKNQLDMWYALATTGSLQGFDWEPVNQAPGFPRHWNVGVSATPEAENKRDFFKLKCTRYQAYPLEFNHNFWIIN